jgi:hypothetical protein
MTSRGYLTLYQGKHISLSAILSYPTMSYPMLSYPILYHRTSYHLLTFTIPPIQSHTHPAPSHRIPSNPHKHHHISSHSTYIPSYLISYHTIQPHTNTIPFHPTQSPKRTREKRSSDVIARSPPGQSRGVGRPPTATTKRFELRTWTLPWN